MPSPYGDCDPSEDYIQTRCLAECEANYVISNCSCKTFSMPGNLSKYLCLLYALYRHYGLYCFMSYLLVESIQMFTKPIVRVTGEPLLGFPKA